MKVVWKIVLIIAVILLILGIALIAVSLFTGGSLKSIENNVPLMNFDQSFPEEVPTALYVEARAGRLTVTPGETLRVEAKNVLDGGFVCTLEDGRLTVREDWGASWADNLSRLLTLNKNEQEIVVYLPEGTQLTEADIDISAGIATIEDLDAQSLKLDMTAGTLNMKNLLVGDAELDMSAGTMNAEGLNAESIRMDMSAGEVNFARMLTGSLKLDMSAGTVGVSGAVTDACAVHLSAGTAILKLLGSAEDYRAEIDSRAGEIVYDGRSFSMKEAYIGEGKGTGTMDLSNSAGTIEVEFFAPEE